MTIINPAIPRKHVSNSQHENAAATSNTTTTTTNTGSSGSGSSGSGSSGSSSNAGSPNVKSLQSLTDRRNNSVYFSNSGNIYTNSNNTVPSRKRSYARIYNVSSNTPKNYSTKGDNIPGSVFIEFPSMPETVDLARSVSYQTVNTQSNPDGFHFYNYTECLVIPISFKLHAFDTEYCTGGPFTLLLIAARLQAFALPIIPNFSVAKAPLGAPAPANDATLAVIGSTYLNVTSTPSVKQNSGNIGTFSPATCVLDIIQGGQLGVVCRGYIKNVRVSLKGPWLNFQNYGNFARNLPSMADYSFDYVHAPGYSNTFGKSVNNIDSNGNNLNDNTLNSDTGQAFAPDVVANLYSNLGYSNLSAQGF